MVAYRENISSGGGSGGGSSQNSLFVAIKKEAEIILGNSFSVKTPFVKSCAVVRSRGAASKASFVFTYDGSGDILASGRVVIKINGSVVFTGVVTTIVSRPSPECAGEQIIEGQAEDELYKLANQRVTRRQKSNGLGPIAFISSIAKRTHVAFDATPLSAYDIERGGSEVEWYTHTTNPREQVQLVGDVTNTAGPLHPLMRLVETFTSGGGGSVAAGSGLHDHTTLKTSGPHAGGPAAAVFGIK